MNSELANNPEPLSLDPAASLIEQGLQQGLVFCAEKRWLEAAACYEAILLQEPTNKAAWNNLGNVRDELGETHGAYQAFEAALAIDPEYDISKKNLAIVAYKQGGILYAGGKLQEALAAFQIAATQALAPLALADYDHSYLQLLLETCEHQHVATHVTIMMVRTRADESYLPHPYPLLAAVDQPAWHKLAAKRHATRLCNEAGLPVTRSIGVFPPRQNEAVPRRIRIAYLSCDWHQHPVPQQLIASIESHDRSKFEVIGIATDGDADETPWRARIERSFDQFLVLGALNDSQIAEQLRSMGIDIAIDLSLYMQNGRPLILASRPCRVQVAFLGYAGTSGAPWIDYLIADEVVIPPSHESFYSEKIIRLSGSFMPDNNQRPLRDEQTNLTTSRIQQGLPEDGFVFCAFSNPYKITPEMLGCWFRLLHAVPRSVLWLQANNEVTQHHIEAAAEAAGLPRTRVVFAKRVDRFEEHLQRYQLADLFLDSFPYNAHVTAADSLWMGLPVLTLQGQSFASRVASSILTALNLRELITKDLTSYETRAIQLATDAAQLQHLRHKLVSSKAEGHYFNQMQYVRRLEERLLEVANATPQLIEQRDPILQTVFDQAQSLYNQEDGLAQACELFKQASQRDPTHFEALLMQGICLARLQQPAQALEVFQSALLLNSGIASLHNNMGLVLDELTMFDEALASFDEAVRLNRQYTQAHIHKAQTLLKKDLKEAAILSLRLALQVDPSLDAVWHQCVVVHVQMRQWSEALSANEQALAIAPNSLDYRYAKAIILGQLGQADKAKEAFVAIQTLGVEGAELASYHLAQYGDYPRPDKAPAGYIKNLFDGFAGHFDSDLVNHLNYQVPRLMGDMIHVVFPGAAVNMLDLGCGTGLVGASLHSKPNRLVGVDLSSQMLAKAKEKELYHELQESDIDVYLKAETSNLERRYFDVIAAADVFIYMGDLALVFECAASLLQANGVFIFSTEDSASAPILLTPSGRYAHHQAYIRQLADQYGFEIRACDAVDLRMELLQPTRGCIFTLGLQTQ